MFGRDSSQFDRHAYFEIDDGPKRMVGTFEDEEHYEEDRERQFQQRIPGAITRIESLIGWLTEKREELPDDHSVTARQPEKIQAGIHRFSPADSS